MAGLAPLVLVAVEFELSPSFIEAVRSEHPGTEFVSAPYTESEELRSARGRHGGANPDGLAPPELGTADRGAWRRAEIAVAMDLPDDLAALAPNLRWIQSVTAGVDNYDLDALAAAGIKLTNASGLGAVSIAEFVLGRLLQVCKHFRQFDEQQTDHRWEGRFGTELAGRTIGIAGLGAIGRQVARRARAFDMTVVATRASARPGDEDPDVDELYPASDLDTMLARCDAVVSTLPSTETTIDLFDADRFAAMPEGAIFCNVGRGAHVVEPDLIAALDSGHLAAAALDVTRVEPLPVDDALWDAANLYLSPHSSVSLDRYVGNLETLITENMRRYAADEPLANEVHLPSTAE